MFIRFIFIVITFWSFIAHSENSMSGGEIQNFWEKFVNSIGITKMPRTFWEQQESNTRKELKEWHDISNDANVEDLEIQKEIARKESSLLLLAYFVRGDLFEISDDNVLLLLRALNKSQGLDFLESRCSTEQISALLMVKLQIDDFMEFFSANNMEVENQYVRYILPYSEACLSHLQDLIPSKKYDVRTQTDFILTKAETVSIDATGNFSFVTAPSKEDLIALLFAWNKAAMRHSQDYFFVPTTNDILDPEIPLTNTIKLIKKLGKGGGGEVWEATNHVGERFALKVMESNGQPYTSLQSLLNEIKYSTRAFDISSTVSSSSFMKIYQRFVKLEGSKIRTYLVMELIHGKTLLASDIAASRIKELLKQASVIVIDILKSNYFPHDLDNTMNIMVDEHGDLRVVDMDFFSIFLPEDRLEEVINIYFRLIHSLFEKIDVTEDHLFKKTLNFEIYLKEKFKNLKAEKPQIESLVQELQNFEKEL